jgi:putative hydrolase of the HAD superfamily
MPKFVTRKSNTQPITVLLFDLGGVLLRLREIAANFGIPGDELQFHRRWIVSPSVREFERGAISAEEFGRSIVAEMGLPYEWQEFLQRFDRWPVRLFSGVPEMLAQLAGNYRLALLSNTNAVHWARDDIAGVLEPLLDYTFLSFRTGLLKPDNDAFEQVLGHYECEAREILFFDDNPLNVDAANSLGFRSCLTRGMSEVRSALAASGVSPSAEQRKQ